jgi:hypothetical protein
MFTPSMSDLVDFNNTHNSLLVLVILIISKKSDKIVRNYSLIH